MSEDMNDKQLKDTFEEYFDGVQPPPESVTERAKNQIRGQRARTKLTKRISVAAACAACACLIAVGVICSPIIGLGGNKAGAGSSDGMGSMNSGSAGASPSAPDMSGDENMSGGSAGSTGMNYYVQSELTPSALPMNDNLPKGLEFVTNAVAKGYTVGELTGYYMDTTLYYAQTEITANLEGVECEATVYAEFTAENYSCDIFKYYFDGLVDEYKGNYCLITSNRENDEWVCKVFTRIDGVKYYINVKSSAREAYTAYLDLIIAG